LPTKSVIFGQVKKFGQIFSPPPLPNPFLALAVWTYAKLMKYCYALQSVQ